MADTNADPLAPLKMLAMTYGIPPEVAEKMLTTAGAFIDSTLNRSRATELANLLSGAKSAAAIGQTEIAAMLIEEVREIMGLSDDADVSDTPASGTPSA